MPYNCGDDLQRQDHACDNIGNIYMLLKETS